MFFFSSYSTRRTTYIPRLVFYLLLLNPHCKRTYLTNTSDSKLTPNNTRNKKLTWQRVSEPAIRTFPSVTIHFPRGTIHFPDVRSISYKVRSISLKVRSTYLEVRAISPKVRSISEFCPKSPSIVEQYEHYEIETRLDKELQVGSCYTRKN